MRQRLTLSVPLAMAVAFSTVRVGAEIYKFDPKQPDTRNLGVWRLTHDPAVRDSGNYMNVQCWSHNGRYTCYTHWGGTKGPGGKDSAEIHVVDLPTGEDRFVDNGINPRWAWHHNWLFFCHPTGNGEPRYETGTEVLRYDADTGEKVHITYGSEGVSECDPTDTWVYGSVRWRGQDRPNTPCRFLNKPNSERILLKDVPSGHSYVHVNPRHRVIWMRWNQNPMGPYRGGTIWSDLDGTNARVGSPLYMNDQYLRIEAGHRSWSGNGEYLVFGNHQVRGRLWNKPFPSDLEMLSWSGIGDCCPMDRDGRYLCGSGLRLVDTRSGDAWTVVHPYSYIIFPMGGDNSTLMDIDSKGSPDGTKIHYHSTRDIENLPIARITAYDPEGEPGVIHVDSTEGFPGSGDVVSRWEVIGYERKTGTTFEGITRQKYGTRKTLGQLGGRKSKVLFPLSAYLLPAGSKKQRIIHHKMDKDHPLAYQRMTDCYVVVAQKPDSPALRKRAGRVEIIPGELHYETRGYRVFRDDKALNEELVRPGETLRLPGPGQYAAAAVEWSGLESPPSAMLALEAGAQAVALKDEPEDFSWTQEVWKVGGKEVSEETAQTAQRAAMELHHLCDGVIAREAWRNGERVERIDLNEDGRPIRIVKFKHGQRSERIYKTPEGAVASREWFGADGYKTEYVRYYTSPSRAGTEYSRWWYEKGRPIRQTQKGWSNVFDWRENPGVILMDTGFTAIKPRDQEAYVRRMVSMNTGSCKYVIQTHGDRLGMPGPSGSNFYGGQFFDVAVGGEEFFTGSGTVPYEEFRKNRAKYLDIDTRKDGPSAVLVAIDRGESADVEVALRAAPDSKRLEMSVKALNLREGKPVTVSFLTFPSTTRRQDNHKVVTFNSGRTQERKSGEKPIRVRANAGETWLHACDRSAKHKDADGRGGLAIQWDDAQLADVSLYITDGAFRPSFRLRDDVDEARFLLWDFGKMAPVEAFDVLKSAAEGD